jgi:hypothetical protein
MGKRQRRHAPHLLGRKITRKVRRGPPDAPANFRFVIRRSALSPGATASDTLAMDDERLSEQEDWTLRRLHSLGRFGQLLGETAQRYVSLRSRDRRRDVREPIHLVTPAAEPRDTGSTH